MTSAFEVLDDELQIVNWHHLLVVCSASLTRFEKAWPGFESRSVARGRKTQVDFVRRVPIQRLMGSQFIGAPRSRFYEGGMREGDRTD